MRFAILAVLMTACAFDSQDDGVDLNDGVDVRDHEVDPGIEVQEPDVVPDGAIDDEAGDIHGIGTEEGAIE